MQVLYSILLVKKNVLYCICNHKLLLTSACHVLAVAADAIEENPAAPPIDDTDSNANNLARYMIPPLLPY